jgi:acylphosphatase
MKTVHVKISGKVQGVWFRASTQEQAEKIGVKGWVKNTLDGDVEALFQGSEKQINAIIDWCYKGPSLSRVKNVKVTFLDTKELFNSFHINY